MALDGKTLRGSQKQAAPGARLLSAFAPRHGLTLVQQAVAGENAPTEEEKSISTAGLGAVGGYAALSDYTNLGGQLTVFALPD